jgi:Rha family phage regulatory protein
MTNASIDYAGFVGNPIVFVQNGMVRTTSLDVAAYFGKRHDNVMRAIHALIKLAPDLGHLNFEVAKYTDEQGKRRSAYHMNRDGFALVAMGFTGVNALRFKLAYIQAFNGMEATLAESANANPINAKPDHRQFPDWPLDEMRVKKSIADLYRMAFGPLTARWIMPQLGFPTPPRKLVEFEQQIPFDFGPSPRDAANAA